MDGVAGVQHPVSVHRGQLFEEGLDDIRGRFGLEANIAALGEEVGHERESERVAVSEAKHFLELLDRDLPFFEVGAAVAGVEVAEGENSDDVLPAGIGGAEPVTSR